jgi:hypothetical protein
MAEESALAKWSHIPSIAKFKKEKVNRARIRKNAHTSRRALQLRREDYGARAEIVADLINDVTEGNVKGEQAAGNISMANVLNMAGILEGFGLNFDALTDQEPCDVYNEKTEKIEPGHRRRSVCEALWDIHDLLLGIHKLTLVNAQQTNDLIVSLAHKDYLGDIWRDENNVLLNPYFHRIDEEAKDSGEEEEEPSEEEKKAADQEVEADVKKKGIDLDKVRSYVKKKGDKEGEKKGGDD